MQKSGIVFACLSLALIAVCSVMLGKSRGCITTCPGLHRAAAHGDVEAVERHLQRGADINARHRWGETPLHFAANRGQVQVVECLLNNGAELEARSDHGDTPLIDAVWCRDVRASRKVVDLLLKHRANPNCSLRGGQTPLIFAARRGRADVVQLLLNAGARTDARGIEGRTPLHEAARGVNTRTVQRLLDAGADVNAVDDNDIAPLRLAHTTEIANLLIEHDADVNTLSGDGWTPLMAAASRGDVTIVERLLCAGADPDATNPNGWTALHFAAKGGHAEIADLILIAGARPQPQNSEGDTPIAIAEDPDTIDVLRARGGA